MTSAALYHYVDRKEDLLVHVMSACLDEYLHAARAAAGSSSEPLVQLCRLVHVHVATECANPLTSQVTDRELSALIEQDRAAIISKRDDFDAVYDGILRRGESEGVFDLVDRMVTRLALIEMCNSVANWYRPTGDLRVVDIQDRYASLARRMVGATRRLHVAVDPDMVAVTLASEPLRTT